MNKLDRLFLRIARTSRWKIQRTALDGRPDEQRVARLALRLNHTVKDDEKKWITVNGTHVPVGEGGKIEGGPPALKQASSSEKGSTGQKPNNAGGKTRPISREDFSRMLANGEVNTSLRRKGGINKHDPNSNEYQRHSRQRQKEGKPPASKFTVKNPASLKDEILSSERQATATTVTTADGIIKQDVNLDRNIGIAYNKRREKIESSWVRAEYSPKDGMHFYPIVPPAGKR